MAEDNVEVIRRWLEAWNHADLDTFSAFYDQNSEVITDPNWVEPGSFTGPSAIRRFYEGIRTAWTDGDETVIRELLASGNTVVAQVDWRVRGRASGVDTDLLITSVNRIERGKIIRQQWFLDHGAALEAAGLSE